MRPEECKIGQRVRCIESFCGANLKDREGTIIQIDHRGYEVGVEFDLPFASGHDCDGYARQSHGRWGYAREIELIEEPPVAIDFSFDDLMKF